MGGRGFVVLSLVLFSFGARAETASIFNLLAPAMFGVSFRTTDSTYSEKLGIDPNATVHLVINDHDECSGNFVTDTTLLTAAHCIEPKIPGGGVNVDGVQSIGFYVSDKFKYPVQVEGDDLSDKYDLAVVLFPKGTGRALGIKKFPEVSQELRNEKKRPRKKLAIDAYFVGFGLEGYSVNTAIDSEEERFVSDEPEFDLGAGVRGWGKTQIVFQGRGILRTKKTELPIYSLEPVDETDSEEETEKADAKPAPEAEQTPLSNGLAGDSGSGVFSANGKILGILSTVMEEEYITVKQGLTEEQLEKMDPKETMDIKFNGQNNLVDLSSDLSRALFRKAIVCEKPPCADNFVGSAIDETEKPYTKLEDYDTTAFSHITARTGRYVSDDKEGNPIYLTPTYKGKRLVSVDLRVFEDGEVSEAVELRCRKNVCRSKEDPTVIQAAKDFVLLKESNVKGAESVRFHFKH